MVSTAVSCVLKWQTRSSKPSRFTSSAPLQSLRLSSRPFHPNLTEPIFIVSTHTGQSSREHNWPKSRNGHTACRRRSGANTMADDVEPTFCNSPNTIVMWRRIEPNRLVQAVKGKELLESETNHLASCELCLELLIFFEEQIGKTTSPEKKAA